MKYNGHDNIYLTMDVNEEERGKTLVKSIVASFLYLFGSARASGTLISAQMAKCEKYKSFPELYNTL